MTREQVREKVIALVAENCDTYEVQKSQMTEDSPWPRILDRTGVIYLIEWECGVPLNKSISDEEVDKVMTIGDMVTLVMSKLVA